MGNHVTFVFQIIKLENKKNIVTDTLHFVAQIREGDFKTIAKALTLAENDLPLAHEMLLQLRPNPGTKIVGITGPPGAGKSTLINELLRQLTNDHKRVAVLSVDPSSPFNYGALLGDRIRMSEFYLNPNVFIRSVASRGALGGLNLNFIEMSDVLRASVFDYLFIETVGVGQSEVEVAGIADTTVVVLVPEAGDEIQTMKAGLMEIASIFVVNKSDRANAEEFVKNLSILAHSKSGAWEIPVVKTIATEKAGIDELVKAIEGHHHLVQQNHQLKTELLARKAYQLIQKKRMQDVDAAALWEKVNVEMQSAEFNLYRFVEGF